MRGFRDRDFIETIEHFLFCVVGSVHPPEMVISYMKYVPSESGLWGRGERRFRRTMRNYVMLELINTINFLKNYPEYLYYSHVMNIRISAVPLEKISFHFKPEERMENLVKNVGDLDPLERKALDLAIKISDESSVPLKYFGVTGSILLDIHQPFSDIDLTVYGVENTGRVKETLRQIYLNKTSDLMALNGARAEDWCLNKSRLHPLTYNEAKKLLDKKWNIGIFQGIFFSIHPVKLEAEVNEKYGDRIFRPSGMIKITATVVDDSEADFMPATYKVEDVKVLEGKHIGEIHEVVSYEGLYCGIANVGERIVAYGKLETVMDRRSGEIYHRVLIGSQEAEGRDYIKIL
ncbi:MAG: hypothetical protein QXX99_05120 [Candidatus Bathyarchaeia archaeon]